MKASLIKKYHIISLPYSKLNGLLPPFHHLTCCAVSFEDMLITYNLLVKIFYAPGDINTYHLLLRRTLVLSVRYSTSFVSLFVTLSKAKGYFIKIKNTNK